MNLKQINAEVYIAQGKVVQFGEEEIAFLKEMASNSDRKRARICAHKTDKDSLHEMLIVMASSSYVKPHRHIGKSESFHIIEGEVDVVIFNEEGVIKEVVQLGAKGTGKNLFYRLSNSEFHTILVRSEFLVLHEVTDGPFERDKTVWACFAPDEGETLETINYIKKLNEKVAQLLI